MNVSFSFELPAAHLLKQNPNMYAASAPTAVRKANVELDLLLNKKFPRTREFFKNDVLTAINGTAFTGFAKGGRLNKGTEKQRCHLRSKLTKTLGALSGQINSFSELILFKTLD